MLAAGVVLLTRLLAFAMLLLFGAALYAWTTLAALVSASMAAWLQRSARRAAVIVGSCNVYKARQSDFMIATWNDALDRD